LHYLCWSFVYKFENQQYFYNIHREITMKQRASIKFYMQLSKTFTKILALLREDKALWIGNGSFGHSAIADSHSDRYLEFFPWINQLDILILNWPISDVSNCNHLLLALWNIQCGKVQKNKHKKNASAEKVKIIFYDLNNHKEFVPQDILLRLLLRKLLFERYEAFAGKNLSSSSSMLKAKQLVASAWQCSDSQVHRRT